MMLSGFINRSGGVYKAVSLVDFELTDVASKINDKKGFFTDDDDEDLCILYSDFEDLVRLKKRILNAKL